MNDNLKKLLNAWNIASIIMLIASFIAFGAWAFNIIDVTKMAIIMIGLMMMQAVILLIRIYLIKRKVDKGDYSWIESGVIIPRAKLTNTNIKLGEELFPKGITPTNINPFRRCVFRLCVEIDNFPEETIMFLDRAYRLKAATMTFNGGKSLVKGHEYMFDIPSMSGEILNFRFSQSGTIKKFLLEELYLP